ncbi:MAG: UvrD-helicase domain-containing protein [Clostridiales bacterium]|nr:UvrD-helicase domain-containing protein [Clostridiales bacterium]
MDILSGLNEQQQRAVTAPNGQVLVVAGAGSGKTSVLVRRIAYLIEKQKVPPMRIMAVTFTNKAAREMKERLAQFTGLPIRYMWIGTFHALTARLLRLEGQYLPSPLTASFNIYDDGESRGIIKKCLAAHNLSDDKSFTPYSVLSAISMAKNRLQTPAAYAALPDANDTIAVLYRDYQRHLRENNALDFDDLLMEAVLMLKREPQLLAAYRERYQHILVDEYQDTNHCQYQLVRLLCGDNGNLFVVGDPDQSIYRWRGADIGNIMDFSRDYPHCTEIQLAENYRSRQNILDAANALIMHNKNRKPKELFSARGAGRKVRLHYASDDRDEAFFIIDRVLRLAEEGFGPGDCAVLYRTHSQSRMLEDQCRRFNIPYRVYGGMKFYERKEVKDTLAYLRFLANPRDTEALNRIYNEPKRGIGKASWDKLTAAAGESSMHELLAAPEKAEGLSAATAQRLHGLNRLLQELRDFALTANMKDVLKKLWLDTGYQNMLALLEDGKERLEVLEELYNTAAAFDEDFADIAAMSGEEQPQPLTVFLGQMSLATDMDDYSEENAFLTLMTLHAAKGLEFPVIFICGLEDGILPHQRALLNFHEGDLEEERRLCYVGMTRAQEKLYLTAAARRLRRGNYEGSRASLFLAELPSHTLDKSGFVPPSRPQQQQQTVYTDNVFSPRVMPVPAAKPAGDGQLIRLGDRINHSTFGDGVVVTVSGSGEDMMLTVAFPGQGVKQLMWRYAPIKKISKS